MRLTTSTIVTVMETHHLLQLQAQPSLGATLRALLVCTGQPDPECGLSRTPQFQRVQQPGASSTEQQLGRGISMLSKVWAEEHTAATQPMRVKLATLRCSSLH